MVKKPVAKPKTKRGMSRRTTVLCAVVIVILLAAGTTYALTRPDKKSPTATSKKASTSDTVNPPNTVDYTPPSSSDDQISNQSKSDASNSGGGSSSGGSTSSPTAISVVITHAQNIQDAQGNNSAVSVGSLVQGTTSGTCTLTATQAGQQSVTQTNSVASQGTSYVCPNFTIPYASFPAGGNWKFTLTLTSGGQSSSNTWPGTVTVNK